MKLSKTEVVKEEIGVNSISAIEFFYNEIYKGKVFYWQPTYPTGKCNWCGENFYLWDMIYIGGDVENGCILLCNTCAKEVKAEYNKELNYSNNEESG